MAALSVGALVLLTLGLHLGRVQDLARQRVIRYVEHVFGLAISIRTMDYNLLRMNFSFEGMTLRAGDRPDAKPVFAAARVTVDMDVVDLLVRKSIRLR